LAAIEAGEGVLANMEATADELQYSALILLTRRWFRRLWVLQEVRKVRRTVFFLGDIQFSTGVISSMVWWLEESLKRPSNGWLITKMMSIWQSSIKNIPAMLGCTNSVYVDEKWTLREWLMMTKSRQASDAKDVVFAGLSAIRSEEMLIDQSLQLRSPSSIHRKPVHGTNAIRTPKHIRLWEVLLLRFVR
jgi:hypothetical protein